MGDLVCTHRAASLNYCLVVSSITFAFALMGIIFIVGLSDSVSLGTLIERSPMRTLGGARLVLNDAPNRSHAPPLMGLFGKPSIVP